MTVATPEGDRDIHATVSTGGSFGASSLQQEIGLGRATGIQAVEVYWPVTGRTQTVFDLSLDGFFRIREERPLPYPWSGRPSAWSRRPGEPGQPRLRRSPQNHNTAGRRLVTVRLRLPARQRAGRVDSDDTPPALSCPRSRRCGPTTHCPRRRRGACLCSAGR